MLTNWHWSFSITPIWLWLQTTERASAYFTMWHSEATLDSIFIYINSEACILSFIFIRWVRISFHRLEAPKFVLYLLFIHDDTEIWRIFAENASNACHIYWKYKAKCDNNKPCGCTIDERENRHSNDLYGRIPRDGYFGFVTAVTTSNYYTIQYDVRRTLLISALS